MNKRIWAWGKTAGMTDAGIAGLMGNIQAESGLIPDRVEILCLKRLKEHGKIYTDKTYTAAVDAGQISRAEFLHPLPGKQYGYGLCQWTSPGRKAALYDRCKARGVSIGDLDAQLEHLLGELKTSYIYVWNILTGTDDVLVASNAVLTRFEQPADTGAAVRKARYEASLKFYDEFAGKEEGVKSDVKKLIAVAEAEIGYLEKKSASDLDDKTANAGSGNFTKYWRDIYPVFQGQPWCAAFVSWCFMRAFGRDQAKKLLKHWPFTYCPTLAGMTKNKTPQVGSIILFYHGNAYTHTGIVTGVTGQTITTIEGNTSGASGIVPNGGGVCRKSYRRDALSQYTKFFIPAYDSKGGYMFKADTVKKDTQSKSALLLQTLLKGLGYKGADKKALTLDGYAGENTITALKSYQTKQGVASDGVCGPVTWAVLIKL